MLMKFIMIYLSAMSYQQSFTKYLRQTLVFMSNSALKEKLNFYLFRSFLLVLTKVSFRVED